MMLPSLSQISGRNLLCDEEKLRGDMYYLQNIRMWLDVKILFRTLFKVADGEGVQTAEQSKRENRG